MRAALTGEARQRLLSLAGLVSTFELSPDALTTSRDRAVDDSKELREWIDAVQAAAEALCPRVEKSAYR